MRRVRELLQLALLMVPTESSTTFCFCWLALTESRLTSVVTRLVSVTDCKGRGMAVQGTISTAV